jgi:hypothetical protein
MIGWRALNFVWFGKRKIAVHAAKTTLLNTIYMSITCRKYVTNSMTWWIYPRVFWFPRGRPRGKKTPGYPVDLRLTLGYRQICSKLKKCATPGKLAKIPGGTPGYMALKSTKTTTSGEADPAGCGGWRHLRHRHRVVWSWGCPSWDDCWRHQVVE